MNLDYSKVTHEQLLEQFKNRIISDPKFKDMSAAAIYQMYMEMMAGTFDMLHFYLGRTAEEMFLDSAKLDSSVIKLAKWLFTMRNGKKQLNLQRIWVTIQNVQFQLQQTLLSSSKVLFQELLLKVMKSGSTTKNYSLNSTTSRIDLITAILTL